MNIKIIIAYICLSFTPLMVNGASNLPSTITITKSRLLDKIKGGWAGQTIGVTFGSVTEYRYQGTFIQDCYTIPWHEGYVKETMGVWPDLYDDLYVNLTFMDVLEKAGFDAPVDSFAHALAYADYNLWGANQAARYNIINGVKDPGHWLNNPHANNIDYQIEADFAGLMTPGMPNSASEISDKVGHIMSYGDGWYGGIYIGAMYSLAFVSDDIEFIVAEALKTVPKESKFYRCMADVIKWHKQYPNDWKQTWFELERKHTDDVGSPEGVFSPLNCEARINAAYVILGLLYGNGNFTKTLEISTRAGQDSDCNPCTAGGILGTMCGYGNIPDYWMKGLKDAEDIVIKGTSMSLNTVYDMSYRHSQKMIQRNGGKVAGDHVTIKVQKPESVRLEVSFDGFYPDEKVEFKHNDIQEISFDFEGTGFVLRGDVAKKEQKFPDGKIGATLYIDDKEIEKSDFPTDFRNRKNDLFWKYQLPKGKHTVTVRVNEPDERYVLRSFEYVIYSDQPVDGTKVHPE